MAKPANLTLIFVEHACARLVRTHYHGLIAVSAHTLIDIGVLRGTSRTEHTTPDLLVEDCGTSTDKLALVLELHLRHLNRLPTIELMYLSFEPLVFELVEINFPSQVVNYLFFCI